jgi:hypothetical protein
MVHSHNWNPRPDDREFSPFSQNHLPTNTQKSPAKLDENSLTFKHSFHLILRNLSVGSLYGRPATRLQRVTAIVAIPFTANSCDRPVWKWNICNRIAESKPEKSSRLQVEASLICSAGNARRGVRVKRTARSFNRFSAATM